MLSTQNLKKILEHSAGNVFLAKFGESNENSTAHMLLANVPVGSNTGAGSLIRARQVWLYSYKCLLGPHNNIVNHKTDDQRMASAGSQPRKAFLTCFTPVRLIGRTLQLSHTWVKHIKGAFLMGRKPAKAILWSPVLWFTILVCGSGKHLWLDLKNPTCRKEDDVALIYASYGKPSVRREYYSIFYR